MKIPFRDNQVVQFVLIGAGLFWLHSLLTPSAQVSDPQTIILKQAYVDSLVKQFEQINLKAAGQEEYALIKQEAVVAEVLYREALNKGLIHGDEVVRRHLIQKMHFLLDSKSVPDEPTEGEMTAWWKSHAEQYQVPEKLTFSHVYLVPDSAKKSQVEQLINSKQLAVDTGWREGHPFRGNEFTNLARREIDSIFGAGFAAQLKAENQGAWKGPITSMYGEHYVYVKEVIPQSVRDLAEVRSHVYQDLMADKAKRLKQQLIDELANQYTIVTDNERSLFAGN